MYVVEVTVFNILFFQHMLHRVGRNLDETGFCLIRLDADELELARSEGIECVPVQESSLMN